MKWPQSAKPDGGHGKARAEKGGGVNWSMYRPWSKATIWPNDGWIEKPSQGSLRFAKMTGYGCTYTLGPAHQGTGKREEVNQSFLWISSTGKICGARDPFRSSVQKVMPGG